MEHLKYMTLVNYLLTFVFGLTGNGLVLYVVARYPPKRRECRGNMFNYYIWNLALADVLFILTIPFFCYATFTNNWIFGESVCRIAWLVHEGNKFASVFTLSALSVCRCLQVTLSLSARNPLGSARSALAICMAVWLASLAIASPYCFHAQVITLPSRPLPGDEGPPTPSNRTSSSASMADSSGGVDGSHDNNVTLESGARSEPHRLLAYPARSSGLSSVTSCGFGNDSCDPEGVRFLDDDGAEGVLGDLDDPDMSVGGKQSCTYRLPTSMKVYWIYLEVSLGLLIPLSVIALSNFVLLYYTRKVSRMASRRQSSLGLPRSQSAEASRAETTPPMGKHNDAKSRHSPAVHAAATDNNAGHRRHDNSVALAAPSPSPSLTPSAEVNNATPPGDGGSQRKLPMATATATYKVTGPQDSFTSSIVSYHPCSRPFSFQPMSLVRRLTRPSKHRRQSSCDSKDSKRKRREQEITRLLLVMVVMFLVCQTPYYVFQLTTKILHDKLSKGDKNNPLETHHSLFIHLNVIVQSLIFISSCCNPILYGIMNKNYRARYRQVLCCEKVAERTLDQSRSGPIEPNQVSGAV